MALMTRIRAPSDARAIVCHDSKSQPADDANSRGTRDAPSAVPWSFGTRRSERSDIESALFDEPDVCYEAAYCLFANERR